MHDLFYREDVFQDYDHGDKRRRGIDFTVDYQGRWYFHGLQSPGPIKRKSLAALFGGAGEGFMAGKGLQTDSEGCYWLASPEGCYRVEVEDVPFIITDFNIHNHDIDLLTNFDECIPLGPGHDVVLSAEPRQGVAVFYARVRDGLWARFSTQAHNRFVNDVVRDVQEGYEFSSRGRTYRFSIDAER
ncbi:MAG: DUF1285 domain-containing protein [Micavibrio aeruginosavorus]|uniref:DUF1285 domain-containing protein n=1 Tax=Micavibrio aeruginosavorus TaxID=349221 RepID=A0A7T5R1J6_9BACT|nr:MAG: DUF1285 domain-containing protein [Micavibrio aeruginosavorus]